MATIDHMRRVDRTRWKEGVGHDGGCSWIRERVVEVGVWIVVAILDGVDLEASDDDREPTSSGQR